MNSVVPEHLQNEEREKKGVRLGHTALFDVAAQRNSEKVRV